MNYSAIFHRTMSEYAHAVDEDHYVFRLRTAKDDLKNCTFWFADRAEMAPKLKFASRPMKKVRSDMYYDYFEIELETEILRIAYYFELDDGEKKSYYRGDIFSDSPDADRAEYFQLPFNLRADRVEVPEWAKDAVVYNIFPDSFANGKRKMESASKSCEYNGEICRSLHGGTIKGIEENLDYIKELGCNCIYLNPIFAANSYHKYDLIDYYHVDPTRGTDEDFRQLVRSAHEMGIRVMIDGVFNHVSWRHPFFKDVMNKGKESEYFDYFYEIPEKPSFPKNGEAPGYLCFAYVPEMPKTNTADKKLKEYFCDVGAYWIRDFDVDGWRLDVANEIDDQFLREFRNAVKAEKKDAIVIGEVWENANHYINGNMMDGAMNYDFRRFCGKFFAEKSIDAKVFDFGITSLLMRYPKQATCAQLNLLDSHDVSRFFTTCGEDRDKMELAVLFQMTFVGMPCIFYGDEKGLAGLEEAQYRRPMEFDREDPIEEIYKSFIRIRNEHSSLRDGDFETLLSEGFAYAFRRTDEKESIIVYINNGDEPLAFNEQGRELISKNFSNGTIGKNGYVIILAEQR